ncbi:MAG: hypothetical protein R3F20_07750 [Planctomycetota bacterium]
MLAITHPLLRPLLGALLILVAGAGLRAQDAPLPHDLKQVFQDVDALDAEVAKIVDGDKPAAKALMKRLNNVASALNKSPNKSHARYNDAVDRYNKLRNAIIAKMTAAPPPATFDEAALEKLDADAQALLRVFDNTQVSSLADPAVEKKLTDAVVDLETRIKPFPANDPRVKTAAAKVANARRTLDAGLAAHRKNARGNDIETTYRALLEKYKPQNLPPKPQDPLDPEEVERYANTLKQLLDVEAKKDLDWVMSLQNDPAMDKQKFSSMKHWLGSATPRRLQEDLAMINARVDGAVGTQTRFAKWVLETDPSDRNHVVNRLLKDGVYEENTRNLRLGLGYVACGRTMARIMGKEAERKAELDGLQKELESALKHLETCVKTAFEQVRMPKDRASDPGLAKIAAETLKNPKYGVKGWERLVVSYDKKHFEKDEGSISHGTVTSTITVYHYSWDEFGVTTAEKVGDEYYMYYNKFKYFHSGAPTTPTEHWILADRFQSSKIKKENISK